MQSIQSRHLGHQVPSILDGVDGFTNGIVQRLHIVATNQEIGDHLGEEVAVDGTCQSQTQIIVKLLDG